MAAKKTSFHLDAQNLLPEYEIDEGADMMDEAGEPCCICDNEVSQCAAESALGRVYTSAGAQMLAFWLGR
ncbi:MAG: hypothetical protein ACRC2T_05995 [Thermoguttaceae bacterium]